MLGSEQAEDHDALDESLPPLEWSTDEDASDEDASDATQPHTGGSSGSETLSEGFGWDHIGCYDSDCTDVGQSSDIQYPCQHFNDMFPNYDSEC